MTRNSDRSQWRLGYTTGSCAAGAAKSACLLLREGDHSKQVNIPLPDGTRLTIPVSNKEIHSGFAKASVIKDAGDDPDVTNGLEITASAKVLSSNGEIFIRGGRGVGIVTKKGLAVGVGESAINPVPRKMIVEAVREVFPREEIEIIIEVPLGELIAKKTLNSRLGIVGGISILGTSGIVKPMSEEAFKNSILPELDQAIAYGHRTVVLTPGNYGFRVATQVLKIPEEAIIQVSNFIGFILEEAIKREIKEIVLLGHVGKLIKVSGGIFHTHNRIADARMEILIANAALAGIPLEILEGLYKYPTVEGAASELIASGHQNLFHILAEKASLKAKEFIRSDIKIGAVFTLLNGDFIGWDKEAVEIILKGGWAWPTL